jgi:hypothetical protein
MEEETGSGMTLILFTAVAQCTLTDELSHQGHEVYEAIAISEVLALTGAYMQSQRSKF